MGKELQNKAWAVLPKEFKEKVKLEFNNAELRAILPHNAFLCGQHCMLMNLFGNHNLTSDTETEEMLTVSRKAAEEFYDKYFGKRRCEVDRSGLRDDVNALFGGKCRVGEDDVVTSKTKPRFKVGDKIRVKNIIPDKCAGSVGVVKSFSKGFYDIELLDGGGVMSREEDIEPYGNALFSENAENENNGNHIVGGGNNQQPTVNINRPNINLSSPSDSQIRIMVAAEAMKGILCNPNIIMSCGCLETNQEYVTKHAVMYADALLAECGITGKGGTDGRNDN